MNSNPVYALITGASQGLGFAMAKSLARRGHNLILVSLPGEKLEHKAFEIRDESQVDIQFYECDLTRKDEIEQLILWIKKNFDLQILINNAGVGCMEHFMSLSFDQTDKILLLNIRSVVMLTHGLLPVLQKQKQAYVLNIGSLASFLPMPYKSVYPASKAFVYSFSRGLYAELKASNVFVGVAHPGGMATNHEVSQRIQKANPVTKATILSVERTAEVCIKRLLKKHPLIIPGLMNKMVWLLTRTVPVGWMLSYLRKDLKLLGSNPDVSVQKTSVKDLTAQKDAT